MIRSGLAVALLALVTSAGVATADEIEGGSSLEDSSAQVVSEPPVLDQPTDQDGLVSADEDAELALEESDEPDVVPPTPIGQRLSVETDPTSTRHTVMNADGETFDTKDTSKLVGYVGNSIVQLITKRQSETSVGVDGVSRAITFEEAVKAVLSDPILQGGIESAAKDQKLPVATYIGAAAVQYGPDAGPMLMAIYMATKWAPAHSADKATKPAPGTR